jgi:hypothetical protein
VLRSLISPFQIKENLERRFPGYRFLSAFGNKEELRYFLMEYKPEKLVEEYIGRISRCGFL